MRRSSIILIWVLLFLLQSTFGLLYSGFGVIGYGSYRPDFEVVFTRDDFAVYTNSAIDQEALSQILNKHDAGEIEHYQRIYARPESKHGPIDGLIEFYKTSWYLRSPDDVWIDEPTFDTAQWRARVHTELVRLANQNPDLAQYQPGSPAYTTFDPDATLGTFLRCLTYFGLPTLAVWLIALFRKRWTEISAESRRSKWLCVHCLYDCSDLNSSTCPECGQDYVDTPSA